MAGRDIRGAGMGFRAYPAYCDSGVEWLGEVPVGWGVKRLKWVASINDEALSERADPGMEIAYVDIGSIDHIRGITHKEILAFGDAPSRARRVVRDGDVILSTVRTYLRAIAPIRNPEKNLIVSTGFAVIRPLREMLSSYAVFALQAPYFIERVVAESVGVGYPAINASDVGCLPIAYPSLAEQRGIVAYLDRETGRIDELIGKKEGVIGLLRERRGALISQVVMKGLDSGARMKDSGVEWLGEIPAGWKTRRLKYLSDSPIRNGVGEPSDYDNPDWPRYIRITDIAGPRQLRADTFRSLPPEIAANAPVAEGDILLAAVGATYGKSYLHEHSTGPACYAGYLVKFSPSANCLAKFISYWTESKTYWDQIQCGMIQATIQNFSASRYRELVSPLPPLAEQREIAAYLDRETGKIDALIGKVEGAIALLREYRAALISAAVTGKIDVREREAA